MEEDILSLSQRAEPRLAAFASGDSNTSEPVVVEHSMFISQFVYLGSDGNRVTKTIDGVLHFGIIVYMSFNFDCTKNWSFFVRYSTSVSFLPTEVEPETVEYIPDFKINGETPHHSVLAGQVIGTYTMKLTAWIPYTSETEASLFIDGRAHHDAEGDDFHSERLISKTLGTLHVSDAVLTGYEGIVTTDLVGEDVSPTSQSHTKVFSDDVATMTSASRLVKTNSEGVYELRS